MLVLKGVPTPARGVLLTADDLRLVPTPGLKLLTNRSKGSSSSSPGEAQETAGVMGVIGEGNACSMMLGEVPTPTGDIELIVLWPLRTEPNPVASESIH